MEAPLTGRVSLRGASAKEDSRDVLLEKIARDRASRVLQRRTLAATLTVQRIWRSRRAARIAVNAIQLLWDERVEEIHRSGIVSAEAFADDILRPFIFFTRNLSWLTRSFFVKDLQRVSICFQALLQSVNFPDARNFCKLACGTPSRKTQWFYQVHRLLTICSAILIGRRRSDAVSTSLLALAMRLLVTLTDSKLWNGFEDRQRETGAVTSEIVQWFGAGNSGFYYAAHAYLMEGNTADLETKESFLVTASLITMAFRPFHAIAAELSCQRYARDLEDWKGKAAAQICRHVLTVPCLIERLPAGLVPAFQHENVLAVCLRAYKTFGITVLSEKDSNVPHQAWSLTNVVSIVSVGSLSEPMYSHFVEAVCCLLHSMIPWIEEVRERKRSYEDSGDEDTEDYTELHSRCGGAALDSFIRLLRPLFDQRQVLQLFEKATSSSVGLPNIARLYSYLLTTFSVLNFGGGALPVLNVLAFTKELLPQLWNWFMSSIQLKIVKMPESRGALPAKEQSSRQLSSKLANTFLKRTKSASSESISEVHDDGQWHIEQLKGGPAALSEDAASVLTLFCTLYAHLLLVLDDNEFYDKQVPFSIDEQRLISAALNTMLYHGFFLAGRTQYATLMEASTRCLRALYERDSRRSFCPAALWLAPATEMRPAIAAAARAHEAASVSKAGEASAIGSILTTMPHVLPFEERVQIFREFINSDKTLRKIEGEIVGPGPGSTEISIRRDRIVEDGFQQLGALGARFKGCINVSFVNEHGLTEAGLDYGGLFKEFLTDLAKAAFDPGYGLFQQTATEERFLFPHPAASSLGQGLRTIEFLGRIVGKALYEGILLEHLFSPVFVSKILGRYCPIDDLSSLDGELHRNLMYLKNYEGDVSDMALDFTVTEEYFGKRKVIDLVQGGDKIPVTDANKLQYVHAMADYKLNRQVRPVVNAFVRGLTDLVSPSWLGLFNAKEFNQLLSGEEHDFDVNDLKANTRYTGGYSVTSRTVKLFWEVLEQLDVKERCAVLKFVTSCSRAPLLGFKHLQPPFTIHKVTSDAPVWTFLAGQDVDRLPSASTCYNILKLPAYRRIGTLREKLQYAIRSNSGFELS
ncbi:E3 ubiquitin-protein ligase UPL7 isoform X1 [Selaginella moellendorffii]|uniref:E3 ubiquitin-protein ligase UPL7 isoform X1 n=1 Tax=Selaginella moellendorffii TaxID=88036 RepID=UPI000D1C3CE2|nr:E3 ubiquitin-protein ligase UPL7 isoform X1 [Selaginella moellendorffii]|eukprot:XP_024536695.1 E3 ubiquitin-protein ligase UPL7 isoform X1 [Selaginella moellendorffii]